jgi:hypothetical protein
MRACGERLLDFGECARELRPGARSRRKRAASRRSGGHRRRFDRVARLVAVLARDVGARRADRRLVPVDRWRRAEAAAEKSRRERSGLGA